MSSIKEELRSISKRPKKTFGQNFLTDRGICSRIVDNIPLKAGSRITEIGPGLGILTRALLEKGYKVRALELDEELVLHLTAKYRNISGKELEIVHIDAIRELKSGSQPGLPYIVSNLPYNISSHLMGYLLDSIDISKGTSGFTGAIIMFQKEFGERLVASTGGKDYGKISVMFKLKTDHEALFNVSRKKFYPEPKVDGMVIKFSPRTDHDLTPNDEKFLKNVVNSAFMNRRKKLKNSILPGSLHVNISEDVILSVLMEKGIENERPERISPMDFVDLSNRLMKASK